MPGQYSTRKAKQQIGQGTVVSFERRPGGHLHKRRGAQPDPTDDLLQGLLKKASQGDQQAFRRFYDATVNRVYGLALRMMQTQHAAEEVASDVYLQVWRHAANYDSARGAVMSWLMVLCRSRALDTLRRRKSVNETIDENQHTDDSLQTEDLLMAVERGTEVHSALSTLCATQRQLIALAYFRGFSHAEIAGFTALPLGTVKSSLRRGLLALRARLAQGDNGSTNPYAASGQVS